MESGDAPRGKKTATNATTPGIRRLISPIHSELDTGWDLLFPPGRDEAGDQVGVGAGATGPCTITHYFIIKIAT